MAVHVKLRSPHWEGLINWNWQRAKRAQRSLIFLELKNLVIHKVEKDVIITFGKETAYLYRESGLFPFFAPQSKWVTCSILIAWLLDFCGSFKKALRCQISIVRCK